MGTQQEGEAMNKGDRVMDSNGRTGTFKDGDEFQTVLDYRTGTSWDEAPEEYK